MSRWENEDVSDLNLAEKPINKDEILIGIDGQATDRDAYAVCKILNVDGKTTHYVKFGRGEIFDPHGIDKNKTSKFEFRKVKKSIFDNYKEYLLSRRDVFLVRARREIKEGV